MKELSEKQRAAKRAALVKAFYERHSTMFTAREWGFLLELLATTYVFSVERETGRKPGNTTEAGTAILVMANRLYRHKEYETTIPELAALIAKDEGKAQ